MCRCFQTAETLTQGELAPERGLCKYCHSFSFILQCCFLSKVMLCPRSLISPHSVLLGSRFINTFGSVACCSKHMLNIHTAALCTVPVTCQDSFQLVSRINFLPLWKDSLKRKKDAKDLTKTALTISCSLACTFTL